MIDRRLLGARGARELTGEVDSLLVAGHSFKDGRTTNVARVRIGEAELVIKRFNWKGWARGIRYGLFGSRARRAWIQGRRLKRAGFPTPEMLGFVDERRFGVLRRAWLLQELADGPRLLDWLSGPERSDAERRAMARKVIQLVDRLHAARITYGDLKQSNLLVVDGEPVLIDVDGMRVHWTALGCRLRRHRDFESLAQSWRGHPELAELFRECAPKGAGRSLIARIWPWLVSVLPVCQGFLEYQVLNLA